MASVQQNWQRVTELFEQALECAPPDRHEFLNSACAGDAELQSEIESLLAEHEAETGFLESPAVIAVGTHIGSHELAAGSQLGQYRIDSLLGRGGMGEVYVAYDRFGRKVALKLLSQRFPGDQSGVARFQQEARALLALNHPHIVTIYDIDQADDVYYIASELVEGETLRRRIDHGDIPFGAMLDIAIQICTALATAHEQGIVHRDIKPENIMIRRDGFVKVLDFGVAKLSEKYATGESEAPTLKQIHTAEGTVIGTAPYMSPEQARGLAVDARTDIWSLGVVLYEAAAGRKPFLGDTTADVISGVIGKAPPPLSRYAANLPEALELIVLRALRKEKEARYQTANELLADLKQLRTKLEIARASGEVTGAAAISGPTAAPDTHGVSERAASTNVSSAAHLLHEAGLHKRAIILVVAGLIIAAAAPFLWLKYVRRSPNASTAAAPFSKFKLTRLTSNGKASAAVISPDGKYVVHVLGTTEQQSLWLRHIATGSDQEIVPANGSPITRLSFSPDGDHIYFVRHDSNEPLSLNVVPVLGGPIKKLVTDIDTAVTFSPDGTRFAFVRGDPSRNEASLIVANADGTSEQKLVTHHIGELFWGEAATPAWSPDGEKIAFALKNSAPGPASRNITTVQVKTGTEQQLTSEKWNAIETICWLHDGSGLVVTASEPERRNTQIWLASYPTGEVRRITNDLNNYQNASLTTDGANLVTVINEGTSDVWVAAVRDTNRATQITSNRFDGVSGIDWTPDGRIVHGSRVSGTADLWIMNADGREDRQLTANAGLNLFTKVSPDGRYIAFMSTRTGETNLWRMDIDGANQKQLTHGNNDFNPHFTPDGQWVVYTSGTGEKTSIWKVPVDGGEPIQLTDYTSGGGAVSPKDGKIICWFIDERATPRRMRTGVLAPEGGAPTAVFDLPQYSGTFGPGFYGQVVRWAVDGRALTYIVTKDGVSNIWAQPLDGSPPKPLTDFKSDLIIYYAWSPDGNNLALARGSMISDVVLISDTTGRGAGQ